MRKIKIPPKVAAILNRLTAAGFSAYAVGGCVRDSLLGQTPQDWDICTAALPCKIVDCFSDCRTIQTGVRYGTVTVLFAGEPFELTTYRTEDGYSDARHPDTVTFLPEPRGDLARRDFTINAMAAEADGTILDCFGGQDDLKNGILRCVGKPTVRFDEDALRILRGLRFAARLNLTIESKTAAAMLDRRERLRLVAAERIHKELNGLLCAASAARVLRDFAPIIYVIIPELQDENGFMQYNFHHAKTVWDHTLSALEQVEPDPILRLTVLLHDIGKPAVFTMDKHLQGHFYGHCTVGAAMTERILRRLRYDGETIKTVTALVQYHDFDLFPVTERLLRRRLALLGEEQLRRLIRVRRADRLGKGTERPDEIECFASKLEDTLNALLAKDTCFTRAQLAVSGRELLAAGIPQGAEMGRILDCLLQEVVEERLQNEKAILVEYAQMLYGTEAKR